MWCKKFWKRVIPFFLAVCLGMFVASFYFPALKENTLSRQKEVNSPARSTFFNPPKVTKCENYVNELRKKQSEIKKWIAENQNISKKQVKAKLKEIEEIEIQINYYETLKQFSRNNPEIESNYKNLLYKENCYEF